MKKNKLEHLALIVDGNRRWAEKRGLSVQQGHEKGMQRVESLIEYVANTDIKVLSLYLFSTENFKREKKEVDHLMMLMRTKLKELSKRLGERDVKIVFSGRKEPLASDIIQMEENIMEQTRENQGLIVNFCINYGGHAEITDACKKIAEQVKLGYIQVEDISEKTLESHLYQELPPVDFMIRTSGETRISNFLLWQISYAEFDFPNVLFPDFTNEELEKSLARYDKAERRFGGDNHEN